MNDQWRNHYMWLLHEQIESQWWIQWKHLHPAIILLNHAQGKIKTRQQNKNIVRNIRKMNIQEEGSGHSLMARTWDFKLLLKMSSWPNFKTGF